MLYFYVIGTVLVAGESWGMLFCICHPYCFTCVRESWGSDGKGDCLRVCLCAIPFALY